jgi:hypothetical protein
MTDTSRPEPTLIQPLDLEAAAAALCCRFGEASAEAYRRATLHEMLSTSRALARALDEFTKLAAAHYRGVHCTGDMRSDVERLNHSLAEWSDAVLAAGTAYREWQEGGEPVGQSIASHADVAHAHVYGLLGDASFGPTNTLST